MSAGNRHYVQVLDKKEARDAATRAKAAKAGRDGGGFVALPYVVLSSPGWRHASHTARSILFDIIASGPNGRMCATSTYLRPLGWTSRDVITRAVADLLACGLIVETRAPQMPSKAAWYGVTWEKLRHVDGLDVNPKSHPRGLYMRLDAPTQIPQRKRTAAATAARQMQAVIMASGYTPRPSNGQPTPKQQTVRRSADTNSGPSDGRAERYAPAAADRRTVGV